MDGVLEPVDFLAFAQHFLHDFGSQRRPGTIFDETYGTVLEIVLHQAGNIIVHERIDAGVIGGGGQDQLGVAESVAEGPGHVVSGQIVDHDLRAALAAKLISEQRNGCFRMAVYGSVSDDDAVFLRGVGGPGVVEADVMSQIFIQNVFREDEVTNGDNSEAMLANAPKAKEGQYQVPKTIG